MENLSAVMVYIAENLVNSMPVLKSEESSDDEIMESLGMMLKSQQRKIVKIQNFVETTIPKYSPETFKAHFRMSRVIVNTLIQEIANSGQLTLKTKHGKEPITIETSVLLTVWYVSNNETFRQIADRFNVSMSTAHKIVINIVEYFVRNSNKYIVWPTAAEKPKIAAAFFQKSGLQNIIGAIDGSHIEIKKPSYQGDGYINRKGYASLTIQAVATMDRTFTHVYCGEPGSFYDARLLRKSRLYAQGNNPEYFGTYALIGDSAYPNLNFLVTPFKRIGTLTDQQKLFNNRLSSARIVVEHAFGLLKCRFRRLLFLNNTDLTFCSKVMMTCCILHNICLKYKDDYLSEPGHCGQCE